MPTIVRSLSDPFLVAARNSGLQAQLAASLESVCEVLVGRMGALTSSSFETTGRMVSADKLACSLLRALLVLDGRCRDWVSSEDAVETVAAAATGDAVHGAGAGDDAGGGSRAAASSSSSTVTAGSAAGAGAAAGAAGGAGAGGGAALGTLQLWKQDWARPLHVKVRCAMAKLAEACGARSTSALVQSHAGELAGAAASTFPATPLWLPTSPEQTVLQAAVLECGDRAWLVHAAVVDVASRVVRAEPAAWQRDAMQRCVDAAL